MEPHMNATLEAEETLSSLLRQMQKYWMTDSLARKDILSIKLDICMPLAYSSTIYKQFSLLVHVNGIHTEHYPSTNRALTSDQFSGAVLLDDLAGGVLDFLLIR